MKATTGELGLYLMTSKGVAVLDAALASGVVISHVVTAPATGMNDHSHVKIAATAKKHDIPTFLHAEPPGYTATVNIAAGWRRLLDVQQLVVLHDSLLPRYRGFSPLVTALVNGETEIGVTAFLARGEPDTGPIIGQRSIPIAYPTRVADVIRRLEPLYADLTAELCATVAAGEPLRAAEQDHARATHSLWRDEQDYRIDWTRGAAAIRRLIDAASDPFPGASTLSEGAVVRVHRAAVAGDVPIEDRQPGKIFRLVDGCPTVVCGSGLLEITDLRDDEGRPVRLQHLKRRLG